MPWKLCADFNVFMHVSFDVENIKTGSFIWSSEGTWISLDFTTWNMGIRGPPMLWRAAHTWPDSFPQLVTPQSPFRDSWEALRCSRSLQQLLLHLAQPGCRTQPLPRFYRKSPSDNIYWLLSPLLVTWGLEEGSLRKWPPSDATLALPHSLLISSHPPSLLLKKQMDSSIYGPLVLLEVWN